MISLIALHVFQIFDEERLIKPFVKSLIDVTLKDSPFFDETLDQIGLGPR
jgi:hypothetical protein